MGNSPTKKSILVANSNHLIDLINLQGRESLVSQHQLNAKLEALSKQVLNLQSDLKQSQNIAKSKARPRSEYAKNPKYTRQDGQCVPAKPRRSYSIKTSTVDPDFICGTISTD